MKSSPLRSTISSRSSSVVLVLISFNSSSLFAIFTIKDEQEWVVLIVDALSARAGEAWAIRMPWKEDLERLIFGMKVAPQGEAMERLIILSDVLLLGITGFYFQDRIIIISFLFFFFEWQDMEQFDLSATHFFFFGFIWPAKLNGMYPFMFFTVLVKYLYFSLEQTQFLKLEILIWW